MNYRLNKNRAYEFNLTVDLDKADLDSCISEAGKYLTNDLKLDGFRRGKVPLDIAKDKLDKNRLMETAFNLAFRQSFSEVLSKEKLEVIETGNFQVKENFPQKLVYSLTLTVFPELEVKNYKKVKIDRKEIFVSRAEVDKVIESIKKSRAADGTVPEINDDFAKSLGRFQNVGELEVSIYEGLKQEKETREKTRVRAALLDKIAENTKVDLPLVLVNRQLDQMMFDLETDLRQQGMELGLFLAKIKKTGGQLRGEWKSKAELLVRKALILKEIARLEEIKVEPEEIKAKVDGFLANLSGVEEAEKKIDLAKLGEQIEQVILNEKVLAFLEKEAEYI